MVDTILYFIEGPIMETLLYVFGFAVLIRCLCFAASVLVTSLRATERLQVDDILRTFVGALAPLHRLFAARPIYVTVRYVFHVCMVVTPVWYYGHISYFEMSDLEWYWPPLPDGVVDRLTLTVLFLALFFLFRRLMLDEVRRDSSPQDFILLTVTAAPYLTGYYVTHSLPAPLSFLENHMLDLHIISGEVMIVSVIFLFCTTRLARKKCVGCTACVEQCPTGTLTFQDTSDARTIRYANYLCICCASCMETCPEQAASLRHELSIRKFFNLFRYALNTVAFSRCRNCGALYAPEPQVLKIDRLLEARGIASSEHAGYCSRCKKIVHSSVGAQSAAG